MHILKIAIIIVLFTVASCDMESTSSANWDTLQVTATAYNSVEEQTKKGNPALAAWGDTLEPGMKAIAVSRDLIAMGLDHETPVRIEGLDGEFLVLDKMNKRWTKKIDIYMGLDEEKAREWGKKQVTIYYRTETDSTAASDS